MTMPARTMSASRTSSIGAVAAAVVVLSTSAANAVCYSPQQALPAQTISQFAANPNQLLQQYPNGGGLMISQIRDLAASDNSMLGVIMGLLTNASPSQKTAIATGLAQAARTCMRVDSQYANSIAQAIANTKDEELIMAYTAVTGEQ